MNMNLVLRNKKQKKSTKPSKPLKPAHIEKMQCGLSSSNPPCTA